MRHIRAFSLIEVLLALGVVSFAILSVIALLPFGLKTAGNSTAEIQAMNLMSAVAADLRNTAPSNSASVNFKLAPLPWTETGGTPPALPNSTIQVGTGYAFYSSDGQAVTNVLTSGARYRITLRYVRVPGQASAVAGDLPPAASPAPVEGVVTISWPASILPVPFNSANAAPSGQIETYCSFPRP